MPTATPGLKIVKLLELPSPTHLRGDTLYLLPDPDDDTKALAYITSRPIAGVTTARQRGSAGGGSGDGLVPTELLDGEKYEVPSRKQADYKRAPIIRAGAYIVVRSGAVLIEDR